MEQAIKSKHTFRALLEDRFLGEEMYWIEAAVWFPTVRKEKLIGKMPLEYHDGNVLFENDIANPKVAIDKIFDFYKMRKQHDRTSEDYELVVNKLSPEFSAIPSMVTIQADQEHSFIRMTREQSYLLDYLEEQQVAAIQGGAGTGKTMLAVEKARRLSQNEKVLLLCFNRLLLDYLRETFSKEMPNVDFYNLNSMVCQIMKKEASEEDIVFYLNNYDQFECSWKYKSIIIDEGQDFSEEQIGLLSDIAELHEGSFYVFFDKNQLIQQRNSLKWATNIECRLLLSLNCRNTRSIAETAGAPIDVTNIRMRNDVPGIKPNLFIVKSAEEAKKRIAQLIRNYTDEGLLQKQIVLLTTKTLESSILGGLQSVGNYRLTTKCVWQSKSVENGGQVL